jgi:hypothetical protein
MAIWVFTYLQSYSWIFLPRPQLTEIESVCWYAVINSKFTQTGCKYYNKFQRNLMPPLHILKMEAAGSSKKLVHSYQTTQSHCSRPQSWYHPWEPQISHYQTSIRIIQDNYLKARGKIQNQNYNHTIKYMALIKRLTMKCHQEWK